MGPTLHERAEHALAVLHRVRAGGERFVGAFLPGASARRMQAAAVADEWSAANLDARHAAGPLWVVLGDGASLGLGASTRDAAYVRLVAEVLGADGTPWRVVNLASDGADIDDVLNRQLPELAALSAAAARGPGDLRRRDRGRAGQATRRRGPAARAARRAAGGRRVATLPPVWSTRTSAALNAVVREEAARRGLRVAHVWDASPRRGRWCGAVLPAQRRRPRAVGRGGPRGRPRRRGRPGRVGRRGGLGGAWWTTAADASPSTT